MKLFFIFLCVGALLAFDARAQINAVAVELALDQDQFLLQEDLPVAVRVKNRSGQTLTFGKDNDWLTFSVEARDHYVVSQLGDVPVAGEFSLDSSETGTKRVNVTPYFDFRHPGRYQITATLKIPQWNKEIVSRPVAFDIVNGTKLKEFDFGVPTISTNTEPEMRKYILQQAIYLKQMRLYLRLTDATGATVFRVSPIAPMLSISKPEAQVDKLSNLHVLHQIYSRTFNYSVINPNGDVIEQKFYDYSNTRPVLKIGDDGKVFISGGVVRIRPGDAPKPVAVQPPPQDAPIPQP